MATDEATPPYLLAHPVYLDVPMMISFLAYLEGGVTTSEEATESSGGTSLEKFRGRAGFRLRFPMFGGDAEAESASELSDDEKFERKLVIQHTSASWFNLLYEYLREDNQLKPVDSSDDLAAVASGDLVELQGQYRGNPLEEFVALFASMLPYLSEQQEAQRQSLEKAASKPRPGVKPQRGRGLDEAAAQAIIQAELSKVLQQGHDSKADMGMKLIQRMSDDLKDVPVHDLLLETAGGVSAILTVSSAFFSRQTNEILRSGDFRVIGKVTRVLRHDEEVNLNRRTVLGAAGKGVAGEMMESVGSSGLELDSADPIVTAPAVQILPMAIFV